MHGPGELVWDALVPQPSARHPISIAALFVGWCDKYQPRMHCTFVDLPVPTLSRTQGDVAGGVGSPWSAARPASGRAAYSGDLPLPLCLSSATAAQPQPSLSPSPSHQRQARPSPKAAWLASQHPPPRRIRGKRSPIKKRRFLRLAFVILSQSLAQVSWRIPVSFFLRVRI